jgi:hypothetical protein
MGRNMVKELTLGPMEESMLGNLRMDSQMVKELKLHLMDGGIWGNSRMGRNMVKENSLILMEDGMMEVGKKDKVGPEEHTTKTETSHTKR